MERVVMARQNVSLAARGRADYLPVPDGSNVLAYPIGAIFNSTKPSMSTVMTKVAL
jgi:hypothetical protein